MKMRIINPWNRDPFRSAIEELSKGCSLISDDDTNLSMSSLAVNLSEDENNYIAELEIPGVKPEDIDVNIEDRYVTVSGGSTHENHEEKGKKYHIREIYESSFSRTFMIPGQVDVDNVEAKCEHGMLKLTMPKAVKSPAKRIRVN